MAATRKLRDGLYVILDEDGNDTDMWLEHKGWELKDMSAMDAHRGYFYTKADGVAQARHGRDDSPAVPWIRRSPRH